MSDAPAMLARCLRWLGPRRPAAGRLRSLVTAMAAAGLGPASINRHLSALRTRYPGLAVPWQREPRGRTRTVSPAELADLLTVLPPDVGRLVTFLAETGMRVSEALTCTVGPAGAVLRTSKNGEGRVVPLTAAARAACADGPIRVSQSRLNHEFRKACRAVGLTDLRPHDLRHTCATRLIEVGASLPVVSAFLGHRDFRSTLRYVHVSQAALHDAAQRLQAGLASPECRQVERSRQGSTPGRPSLPGAHGRHGAALQTDSRGAESLEANQVAVRAVTG